MVSTVVILGVILALFAVIAIIVINRLIYICAPNEVLIFSGTRRQLGNRSLGYRLVQGGRGIRLPLIERVDHMDLTNMIIDVRVAGAYAKGGIPLNVEGVANLKRVKANLKRHKAAILKAAVEGRLVLTEADLARRAGRSYETGAQLLQRILDTRRGQPSRRVPRRRAALRLAGRHLHPVRGRRGVHMPGPGGRDIQPARPAGRQGAVRVDRRPSSRPSNEATTKRTSLGPSGRL